MSPFQRPNRYLLLLVAITLLASVTPLTVADIALAQSPAAQELAERYGPLAYLRRQSRSCDRNGEGYFPAPVEILLGNPEVALKRRETSRSSRDPVIMMGPTAQDLAGLGEDYYLDFPGNPRRVGCTFESDFKRFAAAVDARPTVYARVVTDDEQGKLILQYWFWYYFNDWNNTHEGDWEMIQLVFDATSVEAALDQQPEAIGYAQHGGGETAGWENDKLGIEDGRPVVYPAAGSHATHYEQLIYLGWGENGTGFGCDDTSPPGAPTPLNVVLLPDNPPADGPFAWLHFGGRWGERQEWEFNGPRGPNQSGNWRDPLGSMDGWRSSSIYIPAADTLGPSATGFFCGAVEAGSGLLIVFGTQPWLLIGLVVVMILGSLGLFVSQRSSIGAAIGLYRRHLRTFFGIGLWAIPIGIVFNGFVFLVREHPPVEWLMQWFNDTENARLFAALAIGGLQQGVMIVVITPPVIEAIRELRAGRTPSVRECFTNGYRKFGPFLTAFVIVYAVSGVLLFSLIGEPLAIWLAVRWQFYGQAALLDEAPNGGEAIRASASVVSGQWWQALWQALVFQIIAILPGPLIGALLLLGGKSSVQFANSLSSLVYAVSLPVAIIGLTLAYERFRERGEPEELPIGEPVLRPA